MSSMHNNILGLQSRSPCNRCNVTLVNNTKVHYIHFLHQNGLSKVGKSPMQSEGKIISTNIKILLII
jgi:hypothetical protein